MKKIASLLLALLLITALTGCASMLKAAGGVSKTELAAQNAAVNDKLNAVSTQIEATNAAVAKLSADLAAAEMAADDLKKAKATIDELMLKIDTLSDETLLRLAKLIQDTLAAAQVK